MSALALRLHRHGRTGGEQGSPLRTSPFLRVALSIIVVGGADVLAWTSNTTTFSLSLSPTATWTTSATASGSESATATQSGTLSTSVSESPTQSATLSVSASDSVTESLEVFTNYTMRMRPSEFEEGQEVRLSFTASYEPVQGNGVTDMHWFNVSDTGSLAVRMFAYTAALHTDCQAYVTAGAAVLESADQFGVTVADQRTGLRWVATAQVTLAAPPYDDTHAAGFIVCFQHKVDPTRVALDGVYDGSWQLFRTTPAEDTSRPLEAASSADFAFRFFPRRARTWYVLPDPTAAQYAVVQVLSWAGSAENASLAYSPSSCATSLTSCTFGDALKIVAKGKPCTYELQTGGDTSYYGTNVVSPGGGWTEQGLKGLSEGAEAGGVGVFGTQFANPLVDSWSLGGYYAAFNDSMTAAHNPWAPQATSHAYVYLRLPQTAGDYEVCYSARAQRGALLAANSSYVDALPVWQKLRRCSSQSACASNPHGLSFRVQNEPVGWSMADLTPGTWGDILFVDGDGLGRLSTAAATSAMAASYTAYTSLAAATTTENYWHPTGGDYFRLVQEGTGAASASGSLGFGETSTTGREGLRLGSFPTAGCWMRTSDSTDASGTPAGIGGLSEDGALYPLASRDLLSDPAAPLDAAAVNDSQGQQQTYAAVYVPPRYSRWFVCYRATCEHSADAAVCRRHSGMRVLPFATTARAIPAKWLHLQGGVYTPAAGVAAGPVPLVPDNYEAPGLSATEMPAVRWYANDTREDAYGPVVVELVNETSVVRLDARPWAFRRSDSTGLSSVTGSALRLVGTAQGCAHQGFVAVAGSSAENTDGGLLECDSGSALSDTARCLGTAADYPSVSSLAFYVTFPFAGSYKVCFRHRASNWHELSPYQSAVPSFFDVANPQPGQHLRRGEWGDPSSLTTARPLSSVSVTASETRAGMEALFVVKSSAGQLSAGPRRLCGGGCVSSFDVLRLVQTAASCDVNPISYARDEARVSASDFFLNLICPLGGAGAANTSGLVETALCAASSGVREGLCAGTACSWNELDALGARTPPVFDDIVPWGEELGATGLSEAAALLTLPPYNTTHADGNRYKICYKQRGLAAWTVLNDTWVVDPPPPYSMAAPEEGAELVTGERRQFELRVQEEWGMTNESIDGFYAKLVRIETRAGGGAASVVQHNDNCLSPPASTEAERFAAATTVHAASNATVSFVLTVPHGAGRYALCVQMTSSSTPDGPFAASDLSWYRPVPYYTVVDSGVRWYVETGFQPTNSGLSVVSFARCGLAGTWCNPALARRAFDVSPGADAAKIVAAAAPCSGDASMSAHVGVAAAASGVADLGPSDGFAEVAEVRVVLPPTWGDRPAAYKVCLRTVVSAAGPVWVEVAQGTDMTAAQLHIAGGGFVTEAAGAASWSVDAALRPHSRLVTGVPAEACVLAGASTQYVADPVAATTSAVTVATGFHFHPLADAAAPHTPSTADEFKLVLWRRPAARYPADQNSAAGLAAWGDVAAWTSVGGGAAPDCLSPAAPGTTNAEAAACASAAPARGLCAGLAVNATERTATALLQIPVEGGAYLVCYRPAAAVGQEKRPWLWLPSKVGASYALVAHPAFLHAVVASGGGAVDVSDTRSVLVQTGNATQKQLLSSWCVNTTDAATTPGGVGIPCVTRNAAFSHDLLAVVNASTVCPAPSSAPLGSAAGTPEWFQLSRASNASVAVLPTWGSSAQLRFALPPLGIPSPSRQYKLCVYKASEASATYMSLADNRVAKAGVVYQVLNAADDAASGGGTGYWVGPATGASAYGIAIAASSLRRNSTAVFTGELGAAETEALYGGVDEQALRASSANPEKATPPLSRTPLIQSGDVVRFDLQVTQDGGRPVPFGAPTIEVRRCRAAATWGDLSCGAAAQLPAADVDPASAARFGAFAAESVGGACAAGPAAAAAYGWPSNGLLQHAGAGRVSLSIAYKSACVDGEAEGGGGFAEEVGCGLRFAGRWPGATGGALFWSPPFWVNVERQPPSGVLLDGNLTLTQAVSAEDVGATKTCFHARPCTVLLQPLFRGLPHHAPLGTVRLHYAAAAYAPFSGSVPPAVRETLGGSVSTPPAAAWPRGGAYEHTFTPRLEGLFEEAVAQLNVSLALQTGVLTPAAARRFEAASWARFTLRVVKPAWRYVDVADLVPTTAATTTGATGSGATQPAPAFALAAAREPGLAYAEVGSHLVALAPYRVTLVPRDAARRAVSAGGGAAAGWRVTAEVLGTPGGGAALEVGPSPYGGVRVASGGSTANVVLGTGGAELDVDAAEEAAASVGGGGGGFSFVFRVAIVDNACSRFHRVRYGAGCAVRFVLTSAAAAGRASGGSWVETTLVTPVRVPASTLRVDAADAASVATGLPVRVFPGSHVAGGAFVYDDFHYGDAFVMVAGPLPLSWKGGLATRDGFRLLHDVARVVPDDFGGIVDLSTLQGAAMNESTPVLCAVFEPAHTLVSPASTDPLALPPCVVPRYPPAELNDTAAVPGGGAPVTRWGYAWTLRPSLPCNRCRFTFHTELGAGPEEADHEAPGGGAREFTFTEEAPALLCPPQPVAARTAHGASTSEPFAVRVRGNAAHALWWVFADVSGAAAALNASAAGAYALRGPGGATVLRVRTAGDAAEAVFSGLTLARQPNTTAPADGVQERFNVTFRAAAARYRHGAGLPRGSRVTGTTEVGCTATVELLHVAPGGPVGVGDIVYKPMLTLVGVEGAVSSCGAAVPTFECSTYVADMSALETTAPGGGVKLTVAFLNVSTTPDGVETLVGTYIDVRNVTIVPKGGPRTTPRLRPPLWNYTASSGMWMSSERLVLDSTHNKADVTQHGAHNYTFGSLELVAERSQPTPDVMAVVLNGLGSVSLRYSPAYADKGPAREAVFDVCEAFWNEAAAEERVGAQCVTVRLWVLPGKNLNATETLIVSQTAAGNVTRGASSGCGGSPVALSLLTWYSVKTVSTSALLRYIVYDTAVLYSIAASLAATQLVLAPSTIHSPSIQVSNNVSASDGTTHQQPESDLGVSLVIFGPVETPSAFTLDVTAKLRGRPRELILPVSTNSYWFVPSNETVSQWQLSDAVSFDAECPPKGRLQRSLRGYRAFGTPGSVPGGGWAYATAPPAYGVPFPIESVVRNTAGARATSFASGTLVRLQKKGWGGCNDGGALKAYVVKRSASLEGITLPGSLDGFVPAEESTRDPGVFAAPTGGGVAVLWPVFERECEACTLRLDLCYEKAGVDNCLDTAVSGPADAAPVAGDRTKVTKPFTVTKPVADGVHVYSQRLPKPLLQVEVPAAERLDVISVGDMFAVSVETFQTFAGAWAMTHRHADGWTRTVSVRSVWTNAAAYRSGGGPAYDTLAAYRSNAYSVYGRGGFVQDAIATRLSRHEWVGHGNTPAAHLPLGDGGGACREASSGAVPLTEEEYRTAAPATPLAGATAGDGTVAFYFTRPCGGCTVHVDYTLTPPASMRGTHAAKAGSFPLRRYGEAGGVAGSVAVFRVLTCSFAAQARYALTPPQADTQRRRRRRRRAFSVTVVGVDEHGASVVDGDVLRHALLLRASLTGLMTGSMPIAEVIRAIQTVFPTGNLFARAELRASGGVGNGGGGGGGPDVTGPVEGRLPGGGWSVGVSGSSSVTARLVYARACAACDVQLGGVTAAQAVETAAANLALQRQPPRSTRDTAGTAVAAWNVSAYLGDALFDRAFGHEPVTFTLPSTRSVAVAVTVDGAAAVAEPGNPTLRVGSGAFRDGVPAGAADAQLRLSLRAGATPALRIPLDFEAGGAAAGVLPTFFGDDPRRQGAAGPFVRHTVAATHLGVDSNATGPCSAAVRAADPLGTCTFRAYTLAKAAGVSAASWFVTASEDGAGNATASVACADGCAAASVAPDGQPMREGAAAFSVVFDGFAETWAAGGGACVCVVTVVPSPRLRAAGAGEQVFTLEYREQAAAAAAAYDWAASDTVLTTAYDVSNFTLSGALTAVLGNEGRTAGRTFANRSVELVLSAAAYTWGPTAATPATAVVEFAEYRMVPQGCFRCYAAEGRGSGDVLTPVRCTATLVGGSSGGRRRLGYAVRGVFPFKGVCAVPLAAVSGLPPHATTPATSLLAYATSVASVAVAPTDPYGESAHVPDAAALADPPVFAGLHARTLDGRPAAVRGQAATLRLRVVDEEGAVPSVRPHLLVSVVGRRATGEAWTLGAVAPLVPSSGVVAIALGVPGTTRTPACEAAMAVPEGVACAHSPWVFDVTVRSVVSVTGAPGGSPEALTVLRGVGPLYVVGRAARLTATLRGEEGRGAAVPLGAATAAAGKGAAALWGAGVPFTLDVAAVDREGVLVVHAEDLGSAAVVVPTAGSGVPCGNVEAAAAEGAEATCDARAATGWRIPQRIPLEGGRAVVHNVTFERQAPVGDTRLLLTTTEFAYPAGKGWWDEAAAERAAAAAGRGSGGIGLYERFEADGGAVFPFDLHMQTVSLLLPAWEGTRCVAEGEKRMRYVFFFTIPSLEPPHTHRCNSSVVLPPLDLFSLSFTVADAMSRPVRTDNVTDVAVQGACDDVGALAFFASVAEGTLPDFVNPPKYKATRGTVNATNLLVTDVCDRMVFTVTTTGGLVTVVHAVVAAPANPNSTATPAPPAAPATVQGLTLLPAVASVAAGFAFIETVDTRIMALQMGDVLRKRFPVRSLFRPPPPPQLCM